MSEIKTQTEGKLHKTPKIKQTIRLRPAKSAENTPNITYHQEVEADFGSICNEIGSNYISTSKTLAIDPK